MADTVTSIFKKPKVAGPDPALLKAQKEQNALLTKRNAEEDRKNKARQKVLDAQGGNAGFQTLFDAEVGVPTLGG
jgi:hypothetical protein